VAEILQAVERAGLTTQTTIFVTSDHGFARPEKIINPNVVLRKAGMSRPAPNRRAQCISEGGIAFVYLTHPDTKAEDQAKVLGLLQSYEGIAEILAPAQFAALGLPDPAQNPQMGDLILVAKAGYAFGNEAFEDEEILTATTPVGSHGYLASDSQMNAIFIAAGRGIKPGVKLGLADNLDVAPTIAALFGVKIPDADGKVLQEILAIPVN
jgi:predicted AlkP superfamily pyrophosphatase or phosphodiesterase